MKKEMKSFLLRMAVVLLVLGAICFVGAYGAGKLCAEMLLTPACAAQDGKDSFTGIDDSRVKK